MLSIRYTKHQTNSKKAIMEHKLGTLSHAKSHKPRLVLSHHVHKHVQGERRIGLFNTRIAEKITR